MLSGILRFPLRNSEERPIENSLDCHLQAKQMTMAPLHFNCET